MNTAGKIVISIAAGAAAGALLGILFAPAQGTKTRRRILRKGKEYMDVAKGKAEDLLDTAEDKFEEIKEMASDLTRKGKQKANKIRKDMDTAMNRTS